MNSVWLIPILCVVLAAVLAAIVAFWRDMRKENRRMDHEAEQRQWQADDMQQQRHVENRERFVALETKMEPIANWFNNSRKER